MRRIGIVGCVLGVVLFSVGGANASNVLEYPESGHEATGRGGAWIARASDPLATYLNPAGLAGQPTRVTLQLNFPFSKSCIARIKADRGYSATGDPLFGTDATTKDGLAKGQTAYPEVCSESAFPIPAPQLGATFRVTDKLGIGILPLGAPNGIGKTTWPEFVDIDRPGRPAPQRYMLLSSNALLLTPSIGVGYEVLPGLRLGASFQWGIAASLKFATTAIGVNTQSGDPANDIKAEIEVKDLFVPGFTVGALYSPTPYLDIAGWFKWSAPVEARGDVKTSVNYFTSQVAAGNTSGVAYGDTSQSNCGVPNGPPTCGDGGNATIKLQVPMEAKLGVRYHQPRGGPSATRDPMRDDLFDIELNLTYANNTALRDIEVRFPSLNGLGTIPVNGASGTLPPNADFTHGFVDTFGVKLGGDFNILPDQLAVRAGGFFESKTQPDRYQQIDFMGGWRAGLSVGATYRLRLGSDASTSALDFSLGYMHMFVGSQANDSPSAAGTPGSAGTQCADGSSAVAGGTCSNGGTQYRTTYATNLGTVTHSLNVLSAGFSYRF